MNKPKHKIFAFVGASGSGKTTLMVELLNFFPHIQIIKSTSTRSRRDETDDLFYQLVDLNYLADPQKQKNFISDIVYSGNHYIWEKDNLDEVIKSHCGMLAIIESGVPILKNYGYDLKLIKVVADRDWALDRQTIRQYADNERESISKLNFDLVLNNSFKPGGLEQSVETLSKFIQDEISDHVS